MLEIRPNCECCDIDLPPNSTEAMICSFECTFCTRCVTDILANVCPNCGGGFMPRPIRPTIARRTGVSLAHKPASTMRVHTEYSIDELRDFASGIKHIRPEHR
ncbi:DUF1272 domain-containing protein [Aestuariibacter sp. GS-14]|uniref:DUF1272 domain-containing protein n=1 Tax=Aestuariibacter sp. GS-14 TaxID=2590670 RepID=UPI001127B2A7|nr:DUF1272 domain-containing protein [Aestuariibacter sp. GS-14]TPV56030.1 DUF1272 domain-containing protein [Aestuariibacter sp. GS-14]